MYNTSDQTKTIEQQKAIEQKWHSILADAPTEENVRQAYEELHSFWLSSRGFLYSLSLGITKKVILRIVGSGKVVLDLGCGDGVLACALGKLGNVVLGLDISPKAVEAGLKRAAQWGITGCVRFREGDATNTCLDDAIFDIVVSHTLIEHLHPSQVGAHLDEVKCPKTEWDLPPIFTQQV